MMGGPYCAHLYVAWRTEQVPYDGPERAGDAEHPPIKAGTPITRGWWECSSCGSHFAPVPAARLAPSPAPWLPKTDGVEQDVGKSRGDSVERGETATGIRPSHISNATWWKLRRWANRLRGRYGVPLYLVGSALRPDNPDPRDWDVRMMLPDDEFAMHFGPVDEWRDEGCTGDWTRTRFRWSDQCVKDTKDAVAWTQLNVDFQIYPESHAAALYADKPRVRIDSFPEEIAVGVPPHAEMAVLRDGEDDEC